MPGTRERTGRSGTRILIAGTGGQGVLTAARLLCDVFVELGHDVLSGQLHGMAQRGGAVQSSVIIDGGISPVIPNGGSDFVVGFEPVETARALPLMSRATTVYMNSTPVLPFVLAQRTVHKEEQGDYPDVSGLIEAVRAVAGRVIVLDATRCATEAGAVQALNTVMLGCLLGSELMPCTADTFWQRAETHIPARLQLINAAAFQKGVALTRESQVTA